MLLNNLLQIQLFPRPEMRALFVGLGHKMLLSNPMPATQYFIAGLARRSVSLGILYTKVGVFVDKEDLWIAAAQQKSARFHGLLYP